MPKASTPNDLPHAYVNATGLHSYDQARWLRPPPAVLQTARAASGVSTLLQVGGHCAQPERQEVLIDLRDAYVMLFLLGKAHAIEWHFEGRPRSTRAQHAYHLMAPGISRYVCQPTKTATVHIHFLPRAILSLAPEVPIEGFDNELHQADPNTVRLMEAYALDLQIPGNMGPLLLEAYAALFLRSLIKRRQPPPPKRGGLAAWQVRRATEYLNDHLQDEVSLATLAKLVDLSPFHFARAFKQSLGTPPHAYHCALRVSEAKRLLVDTDLSITQIALSIGYEASQTLARVFQREVGVTPSAFRNELRR